MAKFHSTMILIAVFVLGIAAGIGGAVWAGPRLHPHSQHRQQIPYTQYLSQQLHLSPAQTQQVRGIMKEAHEKYDAINNQFRPQYDELMAETQQLRQQQHNLYAPISRTERQKVRAVLNPEQQKKFDQLMAAAQKEAEQHYQQMMQNPHGHGPGLGRGPGPGGPPPLPLPGPGHFFNY